MASRPPVAPAVTPDLIDLASSRVGGRALAASDEFFAPRANLLKSAAPVFVAGRYTSRGKWMDGWETRRRRTAGHDWCVIRLGVPGVIRAVTVDTSHFRGNQPEACALDAAALDADPPRARLRAIEKRWAEILPQTRIQGDALNHFPVADDRRATHVRLRIYPDGGVARLRVWGEARPDWPRLGADRKRLDLAAVELGGRPLAASDEHFGAALNLLMPEPPADMGDGWETRRRRSPGYDWVIVRLGTRGSIDEVVVDTTHFRGNFPEACRLEGCDAPEAGPVAVPEGVRWRELVRRTRLRADARHRFRAVGRSGPVTHVRLSIFPDGGVARLRVYGKPV